MRQSKNFKIPDDLKVKNPQAANQMEEDALEGLRIAARNNQPAIAIRYITILMEIIDRKLAELNEPKAAPAKTAAKAKAEAAAAE